MTVTITRREWRRVVAFALFVIALTTLPYLIAWAAQTGEARFSGALFGAEDANSYLAKMRIGMRGEWAFSLFYSPEPTDAEFGVFLPYIAAGQIARLFLTDPAHIPAMLMLAFQIMRAAADFVLILALYRFIARFTEHERVRYNALALSILAGGLGWLTVVAPGLLPSPQAMPDITIPEGFGFLVVYGLPHLALARAALITGLLLLIPNREAEFPRRRVIIAGILFNLVGICVPFYLAVIYVLLGVWGLAAWAVQRRFPRDLFWRAVIAAALTLPFFAYNAFLFLRNPAFAAWSAQNILASPPPWEYLLAYLPIILVGLLAARHFFRCARNDIAHALLIGWAASAPILVYLPINVQRRLAEGVIIPLAIFAAWSIRQLVWRDLSGDSRQQNAPKNPRVRGWMTFGMLTALSLTTVLWLATGALASVLKNPPTFRSGEEIRAFQWLAANAAPDSRVLASWATGNALPVYTDLRPFVGLGPETLNAGGKQGQLILYYRGALTPPQREALYDTPCTQAWMRDPAPLPVNCRIRYVIWGENERRLVGADALVTDTPWAEGLTLVYEDGSMRIYQVPPERADSS